MLDELGMIVIDFLWDAIKDGSRWIYRKVMRKKRIDRGS
jgi:hypothetical protein